MGMFVLSICVIALLHTNVALLYPAETLNRIMAGWVEKGISLLIIIFDPSRNTLLNQVFQHLNL